MRFRKTGNMILRILLCLILMFNLFIICMERMKGPDSLQDVPYSLLTIEGNSMEPEYHEGDGVFVWQTPYEKLRTGDVIVFLQAGELVTHRIIAITGGVITAQGCANDIADDPVTEESYRAKVLFRVPGMVNLQAVYENPVTFVILVVLLGLLIFGKDIFERIYDKFS